MSVLYIFGCLMVLWLPGHSQDDPSFSALPISGDFNEAPFKTVLADLESRFDIRFSFVDQVLDDVLITISFQDERLENALRKLASLAGVQYRIYNAARSVVFFNNADNLPPPEKSHYTISGYVQDSRSGETLIGANVYDPFLQLGTTTNSYGFFSLTLPADSINLAVAYLGYQSSLQKFLLRKDFQLTIRLDPSSVSGDTVKVIANTERIEDKTLMSKIDVPLVQIKSLPALLGEVDVLKTIQLLPGVQSGSEGTSGIYVRGGGPDQNLILLDGAPVYNASHLFGFFSVFNADAIKNVNLTKGGFPARYGGRLSSVLEINMKDGNEQEIRGDAAIGLIATRMLLEGPLKKGKSTFIISGRRTYIDILAKPFINNDDGDTGGYYFYDLNGKFNYTFSPQDRIFFSVYAGNDKFGAVDKNTGGGPSFEAGLGWGNLTSTFRWNHVWHDKLFSNTIFTYSKYKFEVSTEERSRQNGNEERSFYSEYNSGIEDFGARIDFDYIPNPSHYIKFGGGAIAHTFNPGVLQVDNTGEDIELSEFSTSSQKTNALEASLYVEDDMRLSRQIKVNAGIHASLFRVNGRSYSSLQPRLSLRYLLGDWSLKSSFVTMYQYIHLLTNSGIGLPTDLWVPVTDQVRPQRSFQGAFGIARTLLDKKLELSLEGYYKEMSGLIAYKEGAQFIGVDQNWENKIETGNGRSYGAELFLQKKTGKFSGWLGYTLSWTDRQFENLNFGRRFFARYDRRHDATIVGTYHISEGVTLSGTWVYGTGNAVSLPSAKYYDPGSIINPRGLYGFENTPFFDTTEHYDGRNGFRMKPYHRLDLSVQFFSRRGLNEKVWSFSVYNAYNNRNPFFLYIDTNASGEEVFKQVSLFPVIPSISYKFSF